MERDGGSRETAGRRRRVAPAIDEDVATRLTSGTAEQQRLLLSRLSSHDPTRKPRQAVTRMGIVSAAVDVTKARIGAQRPRRALGTSSISVVEFQRKYASDDPMLHYLIKVVASGKSVTRADIPRGRASGNVERTQREEEDVLFLTYHSAPPCGFRNVYWLMFIHEDDALDNHFEYFTLSHHGITHFRGVRVIDFVDVDSWITEKRAFDHMTAMKGLQKMQSLLFFLSWKIKAIRLKHRRVRARLASSLFHCDAAASALMVSVRRSCITIENSLPLDFTPANTASHIERVAECYNAQLEVVRDAIMTETERICHCISVGMTKLQQQRDEEDSAERLNYANVSKSSPLVQRAYVFLRLADHMLFESLSAFMRDFIRAIYAKLCGDKKAAPSHSDTCSIIVRMSDDVEEQLAYETVFTIQHRAAPLPFVYGTLMDDATFGDELREFSIFIQPERLVVFDAIYLLLNGYISVIDSVPQVLADKRFATVMTPYPSHNRSTVLSSLFRPSTQVLEGDNRKLRDMRHAIDTYFKQLDVSKRSLLVSRVHETEDMEKKMKASNVMFDGLPRRLLTAAQYEEVRQEWDDLLVEIRNTPKVIQVGVILLNQSSLIGRLEVYVTTHMCEMMDDLPYVYNQFLSDLLGDIDGRIERVMNIPTSIDEGTRWLKELRQMLPSHPFRQAFDVKCANLIRVKQLLKDYGVACQTAEEQTELKKMELEWDSSYETLITCLARVQERDSEHRRSIVELSTKADEYIAVQLEEIKHDYGNLPSHAEEVQFERRRAKEIDLRKQGILSRLEALVTLEGEREEMLDLNAQFTYEHRVLTDQDHVDLPEQVRTRSLANKDLPSERLIQHISVALDVRKWFVSWVALETKWLNTPLVDLHASMILTRIKQFRRRVQFASSRLFDTASAEAEKAFVTSDRQLVQDLQSRVDQMANDFVVFQATTTNAFNSNRWEQCCSSFDLNRVKPQSITLGMIRSGWIEDSEAELRFKNMCERVLVESKLNQCADHIRHRLAACSIRAICAQYRVKLGSLLDVILDLDDMEVSTMTLMQVENPAKDEAVAILKDVRSKLALCNQLYAFQCAWELLCELVRIHDIDEFFTGQVAWKGPVQRQKTKVTREETIWSEFVETGQQWSDRLRRLVCLSETTPTCFPNANAKKLQNETVEVLDVACSLGELMEAFEGFNFEESIRRCELADDLMNKYTSSLRDACPRLYLTSRLQVLHLLANEDNPDVIRKALSRLYPRVPSFIICRGRKQEQDLLQESGLAYTEVGGESMGSLVVTGARIGMTDRFFNVPVVKVGRLKFWLSRLEEEMSTMVLEDAKSAVSEVFSSPQEVYIPLLKSCCQRFPQSVVMALHFYSTSISRRAYEPPRDDEANDTFDPHDTLRSLEHVSEHRHLLDTAVTFAKACIQRNVASLDSILLVLQYKYEVATRIHDSRVAGAHGDAAHVWESQFKVDCVVDDLSTKACRRIRFCDKSVWNEISSLGPGYPISFNATIGPGVFSLGTDYVGMQRIPIISPLTERCFYTLFQALRCNTFNVVAPTSPDRTSGQRTLIRGIAMLLMKLATEFECSSDGRTDWLRLSDLIQSVNAMKSFLVISQTEMLVIDQARLVIEKLRQIQHQCLHQMAQTTASQAELSSSCVFVRVSNRLHQFSNTNEICLRLIREAFQPVTVMSPGLSSFTKTMMILGGFTAKEVSTHGSVIAFFESIPNIIARTRTYWPSVHGFVVQVMEHVSRIRYSSRILLPSNAKWSHRFPKVSRRAGRRVSALFRRSVDGQDSSDISVHTIFHHVISHRYRQYFALNVSDKTDEAIRRFTDKCFAAANGCDVVDNAPKSSEEALFDAVEMSMKHSELCPSDAFLDQVMDLVRLLKSCPTVVVVGKPFSGKTTCIKTLHHALQALEMVGDANDNDGATIDFTADSQDQSTLAFISPQLLEMSDYGNDKPLQRILEPWVKQEHHDPETKIRRWLCVDGIINPCRAEALIRLLRPENDFCSTGGILSDSVPRVLFETTRLDSASPSFVAFVRVLYLSQTIDQDTLISCWREQWTKKLPFPADSKGAENVSFIFRTAHRLISGPVLRVIATEESNVAATRTSPLTASTRLSADPSHFSMISVNHATQSCLHLISAILFRHRAQLDMLSPCQTARIVAFCIVWGFAGHLGESYRLKLDQAIRSEFKSMGELKSSVDTPGDLFDSERLGDSFWNSVQLPLRGSLPVEPAFINQSKSFVSRVIWNRRTPDRLHVVTHSAASLVRVARALIQSSRSFMIVGPRGSGKSFLLRILWEMNREDQAAEAMVDASLDHLSAPEILNWQNKPRSWFNRPHTSAADITRMRCRAKEEAQLFTAQGAAGPKFLFLDDVALHDPSSDRSEGNPVDEFVRHALDHQMGISWTSEGILPLHKAFGATATFHTSWAPRQRSSAQLERLLRHFTVVHVPAYDRQQLQGVFRQLYRNKFEVGTSPSTQQLRPGSERNLSLNEIALRSSVDLAIDLLTVQQTSDHNQLIDGFTFNLHHLNAIVGETLEFSRRLMVMAITNGSEQGTTLLSLGKLHHCWMNAIRCNFFLVCMRRAPPTTSNTGDLAIDEVKKMSQSIKTTSEKYFSVSVRVDNRDALAADVVFNTYRYLTASPIIEACTHTQLEELLTSSASTGSSVGGKRKTSSGVMEAGTMERDDYVVHVARRLLLPMALSLANTTRYATSRLQLHLHLSSLVGLHQLLHVSHAIATAIGILVDDPLTVTQQDVIRLAFTMNHFEVVDTTTAPATSSLYTQWEETLFNAATRNRRIAIWLDLDDMEGLDNCILEELVEVCLGKIPSQMFTSQRFRDGVVAACVEHQSELRLLSDSDPHVFLSDQLRHNLRILISTRSASHPLAQLMRASAPVSWLSFVPVEQHFEHYQIEVIDESLRQMRGVEYKEMSRARLNDDKDGYWAMIREQLMTTFMEPTRPCGAESFLSCTTYLSWFYGRCEELLDDRQRQYHRLVKNLRDIQNRLPKLEKMSANLFARYQELTAWQEELRGPRDDLKKELNERLCFLHDHESEVLGEEVRSIQRRIEKLEFQLWAHTSAMCEYDISRTEVQSRTREVEDEIQHWKKYSSTREAVTEHYSALLSEAERLRNDPASIAVHCLEIMGSVFQSELGSGDKKSAKHGNFKVQTSVINPLEQRARELWRARFPFLRGTSHADRLLAAFDTLHSGVPILVDRSGLFHFVLVHIFSSVPWFTDGNEELERRDGSHLNWLGIVEPIVVQCDDSDKMWQKLEEAVEKDTPVLLVGVSTDHLARISVFARRHDRKERKPLLAELTIESYKQQLRREGSQPHKSGHSADVISSVVAATAHMKRHDDARSKSASLVKSSANASRRSSLVGSGARRASLGLNGGDKQTIAPPRCLGFQLYAVTQHPVPSEWCGAFTLVDAKWNADDLESFFLDNCIRRFDKKLHKDYVDARRVTCDGAYRLAQAEEALWCVVESPTCLGPDGRDEFMHRLATVKLETDLFQKQVEEARHRVADLQLKTEVYAPIARALVRIYHCAIACEAFCRQDVIWNTHSCRFFELVADHVAVNLVKNSIMHDQAPATIHTVDVEKATRLIETSVLEAVLCGIISLTDRHIFLILLSLTYLNSEVSEAQNNVGWLIQSGNVRWAYRGPTQETTKTAKNNDESSRSAQESANHALDYEKLPITTGQNMLSLVERLRRKVRVCSLLFEHIGQSEAATSLASKNGRSPHGSGGRDNRCDKEAKPTHEPATPSDPVHIECRRVLRSVARVTKNIWCEWQIVKEDQRTDGRQAIAVLLQQRTALFGGRRRSMRDILLAAPGVTQVLSVREVIAQHLGRDRMGEIRSAATQLSALMVTKLFFPNRLLDEWISLYSAQTSIPATTLASMTSTLRLLNVGSHRVVVADSYIQPPRQLPPFIDVAWRRQDLVHLPTRVLLYVPSTDRVTLEVLLLLAKALPPSSSNAPLRVFSIASFEQYESRLREQLTSSVTAKERFVVEINDALHFDRVIALVSQVINQHALLCIPEWYIVCDTVVFTRVQSFTAGLLYYYGVMDSAESVSLSEELARLISRHVGLSESDAQVVADGIVQRSEHKYSSVSCSVEAFVSQYRLIAQNPDTSARQVQLRQLNATYRLVGNRHARQITSHEVTRTSASLEFLSDMLLLHAANTEAGLPAAFEGLHSDLSALSVNLHNIVTTKRQVRTSGVPAWWELLMAEEASRTVDHVGAFLQLISGADEKSSELKSRRRRALVSHGIVPHQWVLQQFSYLSDACLTNIVSVAQLLVLLVSRLGFLVHVHVGDPVSTVQLSLFTEPFSVLTALRRDFALCVGCEEADVSFVVEPGNGESKPETDHGAPGQSARTKRRRVPRGLEAEANGHSGASCILRNDEGLPCGIAVEGLVVVEQVPSKKQMFIHELPKCRVVCSTQETSDGDPRVVSARSSARDCRDDKATARASLVELTTIISSTPYQTLPEDFWCPRPDGFAVVLSPSLMSAVPSLARPRSDHESSVYVLAVPVFPPDDSEQEA